MILIRNAHALLIKSEFLSEYLINMVFKFPSNDIPNGVCDVVFDSQKLFKYKICYQHEIPRYD